MFIRLNEYYYNGGESSKPVLINVEGISSVQEYAGGYSADGCMITMANGKSFRVVDSYAKVTKLLDDCYREI